MESHLSPEIEMFKEYLIEFWNSPLGRVFLAVVCAVGVGQWLGSLI